MTHYRLPTQHLPKHTTAQSSALEAIGHAFKHQLIDFTAATELRDLARAGHTDEVSDALAVFSQPGHERRRRGS